MSRKTLVYLVIVLALAGGWLLLRTRSEPIEKRAPMLDIDASQVWRVHISSAEGEVDLLRHEDGWRLIHPIETPVDDERLNSFFQAVLTAEIYETPVAASPSSHPLYAVDAASGTRLRLFAAADTLLADVWLGSRGNRFFSAVRVEGHNEVYRVTEDLTGVVTSDSEKWREHDLLVLDPDDIARIEVRYRLGHYSLTWEPSVWVYRSEGGTRPDLPSFDVPRDNRTFFKLVNVLTQVRSLRFYDNAWEEWAPRFEEPVLQVWLTLKNDETHELVFARTDRESTFVMRLDGRTDMLYLQPDDFVKRFTLSAEHFADQSAAP
ncbi:MAG: DUF4340 domain-containing protein [Candidatus Cloacimonetes bacterium]|nr:DUF4340 domain-containing protein [Candidatus Cloacimonadota bacterium]